MPLYFAQGISQALFDICVNGAIIKLWSGKSKSPINGAQAGYGIGALVAVFISRPFVKFNPPLEINQYNNSFANQTSNSSNILLHVPYSVAGLIGVLVSVAFVVAQYFEFKNTKRFNQSRQAKVQSEETVQLNENKIQLVEIGKLKKLSSLVFNDKIYDAQIFKSKLLLTTLSIILAMSIGGFSIVLVNFMLPYITKGPAKLTISSFYKIQMLFWIFNTIGRLIASFVAYKLDTLLFFFLLISCNFICILLYAIPYFNTMPKFYFIIIGPLAAFNAPLIPSIFMVINHMMGHVSSVLIAIFGIGLATGAISAQYFTGFLLDEFKPNLNWLNYTDTNSVYIIPFIILANVSVSFILIISLILVFNNVKSKLLNK